MKVVSRFAVAGLDQAARDGGRRGLAIGAIDETSQVKQGERTAGVKRHMHIACLLADLLKQCSLMRSRWRR